MGVEGDNGLLETRELHHRVRDLTEPEWLQSLEEGTDTLLSLHLGEALAQGGGVVGGLDADLDLNRW